MQIVDAQVHVWEVYPGRESVGGDKTSKPLVPKNVPASKDFPFSKDDLLREMEVAGVNRAVIIPNSEGGSNDLALGAARAHPDRFAVMGVLDFQSPASRGLLASWRDQPGMLGIRLNLRKAIFRTLLTEGQPDWVWDEAEAAQVPVMFLARHSDLHLVYDVAQRHPQLKLALDHLGLDRSLGKDEQAFRTLDSVLRLSSLPNIAVKVSALPLFTTHAYPYHSLHPYLRRVYDAFGPKRMFWGSDMTRLSCPYREVVTMFTEEMPWLSSEDKEWIMGRALCEWSGWQ